MNRLAPLVARTSRSPGRARPWVIDAPAPPLASGFAADVKLFATAWLGGMVFFTTLLA